MAETSGSGFPWGPGGPRLVPESEVETVTFSSIRNRQTWMQTEHLPTGANHASPIADPAIEEAQRAEHREWVSWIAEGRREWEAENGRSWLDEDPPEEPGPPGVITSDDTR